MPLMAGASDLYETSRLSWGESTLDDVLAGMSEADLERGAMAAATLVSLIDADFGALNSQAEADSKIAEFSHMSWSADVLAFIAFVRGLEADADPTAVVRLDYGEFRVAVAACALAMQATANMRAGDGTIIEGPNTLSGWTSGTTTLAFADDSDGNGEPPERAS
jgi:hypothetical protein